MSSHPTPADLELLRNDVVYRHVGHCEMCQEQIGTLDDLYLGLDDTIDRLAETAAYVHVKRSALRRLYARALPEDLAADAEIHLRHCDRCRQLAAQVLVESSRSPAQEQPHRVSRPLPLDTVPWTSDFDAEGTHARADEVASELATPRIRKRRSTGLGRFAIVGDVSGAGKTTTAIMLASRLALQRGTNRLLCIDLDPAGELTQYLLGTRDNIGGGVSQLLEGPAAELSSLIVRPKRMRGVWLLPSDRNMRGIEARIAVAVGGTGWETLLRDRIASMLRTFRYVVIDCPSSRGVLTINALAAAELALVADIGLNREATGVDELGVNSMLKFVVRIRERHNASLRVRVMSTQFNPDDRAPWPGTGLTPKAALRFAMARGARPENLQFDIYDTRSGSPGSAAQLVHELMKTAN